jgi:UDP-N-acetylglucosamine transferase subunit ALG13
MPYIASRDYMGVTRALAPARQVLRDEAPDVVISTGAAIALATLPLAVTSRRRAIYIESVSRFEGPSLTGRFLARMPGVATFTQHETWANRRWKYRGSVLEHYFATFAPEKPQDSPLRIFITLGTIKPFRFDLLVDKVLEAASPGSEFIWQLGDTSRTGLPGMVHATMPAGQFDECVQWADVVVSHAGVGSALRLLELGKAPVLVPRRKSRGEHVDDHQEQVAKHLGKLGLAISREAPALTRSDLIGATSRKVGVDVPGGR